MVAANDNGKRKAAGVSGPLVNVNVNVVPNVNVTDAADAASPRNVTGPGAAAGHPASRPSDAPGDSRGSRVVGRSKALARPEPPLRITDKLGSHIEVRYGEWKLLSPLMDAVIADLAAKKANDR
jgi:hypothetical protein